MTLKVIRQLQAFSSAILRTFVQHFTRFQLTACSCGPSATAGLLVIASLDISKAFDRVHHFKLCNSLLSTGIPVAILFMSSAIGIVSYLLPLDRIMQFRTQLLLEVLWVKEVACHMLFLMFFINVLILQLKKLNIGYRVSGMFVGCLLYADDIILLSPSVTDLQEILNTC